MDEAQIKLRDFFAAMAMQGILSSLDPQSGFTSKDVAKLSYEQADAMVEARKK